MKKRSKKLVRLAVCSFISMSLSMASGTAAFAEEVEHSDTLSAGISVYDLDVASASLDNTSEEATIAPEDDSDISLRAGEAEAVLESSTQIGSLVMANVKDSVNVRAEANEEAETVGKFFQNCGGVVLEQADGWTKIQSGNLEGWAKDEYLFFGKDAEALREEAGALKATINAEALRVRKEASEDAGVYGNLDKDEKLEVVEQAGEWVAVQYDGDTVGYVSADFVSLEFSVETGKTNKEIADEERAKELKKLTKNQAAVPTNVSDVTLLAALIQCEAGSQPYEGQLAVGAVVMNRVRGGYSGSIMGVITAPGQFPPATNGSVAAVVARGPKASCMQAAQAAVSGQTNVGTATRFARAGSRPGIVIGAHVFW